MWDLGGQTSIRPYWRCYYQNTNAVIYVVDSADVDRMAITKQASAADASCGSKRRRLLLPWSRRLVAASLTASPEP